MKSLALRVLSDFGVDGVEPQALGSRKGRLALCVLALAEGQVVPADVLVDTLWGDAPPAQPEDQLAVLVSRLRSVLGRDRIQHRDRGYLLICDWLDASELAALTEEMDRRRGAGNVLGAAAAARIALSLLRGYGLPSVPGEWAQLRLAELDRLAGRARRVAAAVLFEAGDWMAAADAATAAVAADGYDEESLRVLLRAYVAGGQVAAALAAYARARERLAAELGTDPSPQTAALYTAILRGEVPAPPPEPARHPAGLVGRDDELAYLDTIAGRPRAGPTELVVVDGEAGIGKTTLLRAWAAQRAAAGEEVLLASCGQLDRAMPLDALLAALSALLRRLGPDVTADLLGRDAVTLTALLGSPPEVPAGSRPARNPGTEQILADSMLGPAVLYAALVRVLARLAQRGPLVVVIDDAHLAGHALANWLSFARRENMPAVVVAAVRSGEGPPLPATASVHLGLLGREAAAELVGPSRADELYERSKGHPLFLTELASHGARAELPASLVESVSARCDELGSAGAMLRAAAVIGPELDIELLAALLGRPPWTCSTTPNAPRPSNCWPPTAGGSGSSTSWCERRWPPAPPWAGPPCCTGRPAACWPASRTPTRPWSPTTRGWAGTWCWPPGRCGPPPNGPPSASTTPRPRPCWTTPWLCTRSRRPGSNGPGSVPAAAGTRRRWPTSSSPRPPGPPPWRSARGPATSTAGSPRPRSSPRTARWPRPTRPSGPGAWPSAAGPGTRPVTWPRPSCSSARRSRWPRGPTG